MVSLAAEGLFGSGRTITDLNKYGNKSMKGESLTVPREFYLQEKEHLTHTQ